MVFDWQPFLFKIPPWGKLLQFSWGKLLHCICHTWGIGLTWNATELPFSSSFTQKYMYTISIHFHMTKKFKMLSFITTIEINVHNSHLPLTRAQTKKNTNKQTKTMAHAYTLIPPQTHENIVPYLAGPNCRESTVIKRVTTYSRWCNNLPQPWRKLLLIT